MSWGLVLAGGGVTGLAWEAGVIVGLHESDIDLTTADIVVGTSAGSIVGSLLLGGVTIDEISTLVADPGNPPLVLAGKPKNDGNSALNLQVFTEWMSAGQMTAPKAAAIGALAAGALTMTEDAWVGAFEEALGALTWAPALRMVSIGVESGERRLWSADDGVPLARAVASSCAVPGMFPPVEVGGGHYLDGGLWSPISADLLSGQGLGGVVVISPLGGEDPIGMVFDEAVQRELAGLKAEGVGAELLVPEDSISPLGAFDDSQRIPYFDAGRVDGKAAADRVRALIAAS